MTSDSYREIAAALGHFIIAFNELEVALGEALMQILKYEEDDVGSAFASILGFGQKHDFLKAMASKIPNEGVRKEFLEHLESAKSLNGQRNRFVHAEYTPVPGGEGEIPPFLRQRLRDFTKGSRFVSKTLFEYVRPTNSNELVDLANDASSLAMAILQLSERFYSS